MMAAERPMILRMQNEIHEARDRAGWDGSDSHRMLWLCALIDHAGAEVAALRGLEVEDARAIADAVREFALQAEEMADGEWAVNPAVEGGSDPPWAASVRAWALVLFLLAIFWAVMAGRDRIWNARLGARVPPVHVIASPVLEAAR